VGDDIERQVVGIGIILIQLSICQITNVIYVMHVPTLKNLLSISKATNKGHSSMQFFGNRCVMKSLDQNHKQFVFHCQQEGNLYPLDASVTSSSNKSNVTYSL
jgi:hypothetical protein